MRTTLSSLLNWFRALPASHRTLLLIIALLVAGLALSWISRPTTRLHGGFPETSSYPTLPPGNQPDSELKEQWERIKQSRKTATPAPIAAGGAAPGLATDDAGYGIPMIAYAAELAVATKEFAHSRATLEEILERHHGYAARLRMVGEPASSVLTATLRVPSSEFTAAVNDLKTLGSVEREEQTADEITQQRRDLEARLINAQTTVERLQEILAKGGENRNLLEVERQLRNVTAEISRLEAQRATDEHQVIFAQVLLSLREEVKPRAVSLAAEFQQAATAGLSDLAGSLSAIALFLISRGPVTLLWVVLVFFPGRWMWRKWHTGVRARSGVPQGAPAE